VPICTKSPLLCSLFLTATALGSIFWEEQQNTVPISVRIVSFGRAIISVPSHREKYSNYAREREVQWSIHNKTRPTNYRLFLEYTPEKQKRQISVKLIATTSAVAFQSVVHEMELTVHILVNYMLLSWIKTLTKYTRWFLPVIDGRNPSTVTRCK
jgi:hypothetical protein